MHVQQQAGNSAQHWSTVVLPINTVATAGAWILTDWRGDGGRTAGFFEVQGHSEFRLSTAAIVIVWRPHSTAVCRPCGRRAVARLKYLVIAQSLNIWAVRPPSQSTHRPTREAGQILPISITLPAPATLHETPFVDVAEGIYRNMLVTESCAEYWLRLRGNYRDKDMPRYDLNIAIFDTIQYIVPSLQGT